MYVSGEECLTWFEDCAGRIDRAVGVGVFATPTLDRARQEVQVAEHRRAQGLPQRMLEGITVAWKDVFDVAGYATRAGTLFFSEAPASLDDPLVAKLHTMGAICVGKTSLTELACSVLGENDVVPAPGNPWTGGARVCGGSSSGSAAAVARSLVDVSIGTDCGGSVRLPAAWCGVVGFKPTAARIATSGVVPFSPSLDAVGQIGPTVADVITLYVALSDHVQPPVSVGRSVQLIRAHLPESMRPDPEVAVVYDRALLDLATAGIATEETRCDPLARAHELRGQYGGSIAAIEGASLWRDRILKAGDLVSMRLRRWAITSIQRRQQHLEALTLARREFVEWFETAVPRPAVLVLPTSPVEPPLVRSLEDDLAYDQIYTRAHSLLWPFNELDAPAISIPCGRTGSGLPVGLQLVAPRGRDDDVLRAATVVEAVLAHNSSPIPAVKVNNP